MQNWQIIIHLINQFFKNVTSGTVETKT